MLKKTFAFTIAAIMLFTITAFAATTIVVSDFSKTCLKNTTLAFTAEDFNSHATVDIDGTPSTLNRVVITELPAEKGTLKLDTADINVNDEILAADFGKINFVPDTDETGETTFKWKGKKNSILSDSESTVTITISEPVIKPVANDGTLSVVKNTPKAGTLTGSDSDDRALKYSIVDTPAHGVVVIDDEDTGAYTFTPEANYTGPDAFTFKVNNGLADSDEATIAVTIAAPAGPEPLHYADMNTHWAAYSAGMLGTMGKIVGEKIDNKYYFRPDINITRGDFILFVAAAFDIEESDLSTPYFKDNVPDYLVKISNAFHDKDILTGVSMGGGNFALNAGHSITKLEAFKIIKSALDLETVSDVELTFSDKNDIPKWGSDIVETLVAFKIVDGSTSGKLSPNSYINRGQAAQLVYKAILEYEKQGSPAS